MTTADLVAHTNDVSAYNGRHRSSACGGVQRHACIHSQVLVQIQGAPFGKEGKRRVVASPSQGFRPQAGITPG